MRIIGIATTVVAGAVTLYAVVLGVRAVPDVRRYLRIRAM